MKTELSSLEVGVLADELQGLLGARIDKIYQLDAKDIVLQLHLASVGKVKVRLQAPRAAYITAASLDFPETPPGFCLHLRKHLDNVRLAGVRQLGSERILEMSFMRGYSLVVELFSKGNIVLCENETIIAVAERQVWSTRNVSPGNKYSYPEKEINFYSLDAKHLATLFSVTNKDSVVKALAMDLGLGGVYAEELCLAASVDKSAAPSSVGVEDQARIVAALRDLLGRKKAPCILYDGPTAVTAVPFPLQIYSSLQPRNFGSFSEAIDYYYSHEFRPQSAHDRRVAVIQRIIAEQEKMIAETEASAAENTAKAEAVYNNYSVVSKILEELAKAREKHSWAEIKSRLEGHKVIREIDEQSRRVVVEV